MEVNDNTIMWFGEHRDKAIANVPASWLVWWDNQNPSRSDTKGKALKKYIADNISQLTAEAALKSR